VRINLEQRFIASLLATILLVSTTAVAAPPPGKGKDKGGEEDPPTTTPAGYQLEIMPTEGALDYPVLNDRHQAIYQVNIAEVTSQAIHTQASTSTAIIDLDTGAILYIDNLLTEPTPWTVLAEGVSDATFHGKDLNNNGDIVGYATYYRTPDRTQYEFEGFLLKRVGGSYQPISFGNNLVGWLTNDLGDIAFREIDYVEGVVGAGFLPSGGDTIQFNTEASYIDAMNLWGQILCDQGSFNYFVWNPDGTIQYLPDLKLADDINDWGMVSGTVEVLIEFKQRGKIRTRIERVPAIWTEANGVTLLTGDDFASKETDYVLTNNQYSNGEATVAAQFHDDDIWLKLPNQDGFYLSNAMTSSDFEAYRSFATYAREIELPTPLLEDGTVDNEAFPLIAGGDTNSTGVIWVLRPVPPASSP
jgi:hypothetical protein